MRPSTLTIALLIVSLAGMVSADQAATREYWVEGRVVDSMGHPFVGETILLSTAANMTTERCDNEPVLTDAMGDWRACYQNVPGSALVLNVQAANSTASVVLDSPAGVTFVPTIAVVSSNRSIPTNYTIRGRLWEATDGSGMAWIRRDSSVMLQIVAPNGTTAGREVRTDGFGDYEFQLGRAYAPPGGTVEARTRWDGPVVLTAMIDPILGLTFLDHSIPGPPINSYRSALEVGGFVAMGTGLGLTILWAITRHLLVK